MPQTAAQTRTQLADQARIPRRRVADTGLVVNLRLTYADKQFVPEDLFDALAAKYGTAPTLSTNLTGANNDLTYMARAAGGSDITIAYVDPAANSQSLAVTVTGRAISVSLATDGSGVITSTAAQIRDAINGNSAASALVFAANKAANDGTGVVTALTATALASGDAKVTADTDALGPGNFALRIK